MAPGENEFDTPGVRGKPIMKEKSLYFQGVSILSIPECVVFLFGLLNFL